MVCTIVEGGGGGGGGDEDEGFAGGMGLKMKSFNLFFSFIFLLY